MKRVGATALICSLLLMGCGNGVFQENSLEDTKNNMSEKEENIENLQTIEKDESEQEQDSQSNIIKEQDYDLENGDILSLWFSEKDGKISLGIWGQIANEEKASMAFVVIGALIAQDSMKDFETSCAISCDSGMITYVGGLLASSDGDNANLGYPEWFNSGDEDFALSDKELSEFVKLILNDFDDFFSNVEDLGD